jgi:hypothetical protein
MFVYTIQDIVDLIVLGLIAFVIISVVVWTMIDLIVKKWRGK